MWKLVSGQLSGKAADAISGPVGVVKMVSNAATTGLINVLYLTAIISLNIGLMNLLPQKAKHSFRSIVCNHKGLFYSLNRLISFIGRLYTYYVPSSLDGWRILMLIIEALRGGKKFPAKIEGYINAVGLILILGLMLFVTYKDIIRLLS